MSNIEDARAGADANKIEALAALWLRRRHWNLSAVEHAELDTWLAASAAHRVAFWRLEAAWGRTERLAALRTKTVDEPVTARVWKISSFLSKAMAGAVAIVLVGFGAAWWLLRPVAHTYSTALGGHETISLPDGSIAELNTSTTLHVAINAAARAVLLEKGEVYFQVRHDAARPFTVEAGGYRITDLGTNFVVRNDGQLKVTLLKGRVRLDSFASPRSAPIFLAPGEEFMANAAMQSVTRKSAEELSAELGWKQGALVFQNTSLADAAAEFNRYNSKKLIIADMGAARRTIGASFPANNVDLFAHMARDVLRLHVEDRGDEIVISR